MSEASQTLKTKTNGRAVRYGESVLKWRWLILLVSVVVVVLLAAGGQRLSITNDSRVFFSDDNPQLLAFEALENTYSEANTVLVGIASREGDVFQRETLMAVESLTEQFWQLPYSSRVDSLTNYSHSRGEEDDLIVEDLVQDAAALDDAALAHIKDIALSEIQLVNRLVAADGGATGLLVNFVMPEDLSVAVPEIMSQVWPMIEAAREAYPGVEFHVTGSVATSQAFGDATLDDMMTLGPIIVLALLVVLIIMLRSISGTIGTLLIVLFSAMSAMGLAGWFGMVLSPGSAGAPTIIMTVAIAHSVHVTWSTVQGMRRGLAKRDAIIDSLRINLHPVFLTTITTAIGFLSMNASDAPPFHALGNIVAMGVVSAFIFSVTFLPALLSVLPLRTRPMGEGKSEFFDRFGGFVVGRRKPLLIIMSGIVIALAAGVPQVELNDNWTNYFSERYEFRRDTDFVSQNLSGVEYFEYSLESGRDGGITEPEYLTNVDAFAEWYRGQDKVVHVAAFPDIMKRLNKNMHGDDPDWHRIPDDPELAAQYLLLYELSLPFGRDLNDQINVAKSSTRMTVVARDLSAKEQRAMDERAVAWQQANIPAHMVTEGSGLIIMFAHLSQRNIDGMLRGTIGAMALISLILIFALKSLRLGLISLIPNFVPAAMAFGLWGYAIGHVGVAASVVTAVTFGIVVDDTIHFLSKYLRGRREHGHNPQQAVRYAFNVVGHALWTTTAVLAAGFAVLATSGFEVNWSMGLLTCITIVLALIADFFLLPPLIMLLDRSTKK